MATIFLPPFDLMNLGARLKEQRQILGYTQVEAADALNIYRLTQLNYESSRKSPPLEYLNAAAGLGFDVHYILTGCTTRDSQVRTTTAKAAAKKLDEKKPGARPG